MSKKLRKVRVIPKTEFEKDSIARYGEIWVDYPGIAVRKPGHDFLVPERAEHFCWWPSDQIVDITNTVAPPRLV